MIKCSLNKAASLGFTNICHFFYNANRIVNLSFNKTILKNWKESLQNHVCAMYDISACNNSFINRLYRTVYILNIFHSIFKTNVLTYRISNKYTLNV